MHPAERPSRVVASPTLAVSQPAAQADLLGLLGATGATWEAAVAAVPPRLARSVAIAFLRDGDLACTRTTGDPDDHCGGPAFEFAPVDAAAALDDPCLRRLVARWALTRLEATDVPAVADALAAIVALPRPEQALADEVVALVPPGDDDLRLRLIAAAAGADRGDVADALLAGLTPAGAARALVELRRDRALEHLGAHPPRDVLVAALGAGLTRETELSILAVLAPSDLSDPEAATAVRAAAGSPDCELAAAAAILFDDSGDDQYLPRRMPLTSPAAATRALCVARHVSALEAQAVLEPLVARDGFELVVVERDVWGTNRDHADPDLDGDGDPDTTATRDRVTRAELAADTLIEWLPTQCDDVGARCTSAGAEVQLTFDRTPSGGLYLEELRMVRDNDSGCGC